MGRLQAEGEAGKHVRQKELQVEMRMVLVYCLSLKSSDSILVLSVDLKMFD